MEEGDTLQAICISGYTEEEIKQLIEKIKRDGNEPKGYEKVKCGYCLWAIVHKKKKKWVSFNRPYLRI